MKKGIILVPFMTGYGGTETVIKNLFSKNTENKKDYSLEVYSLGGSIDYTWAKNIPINIKWISRRRSLRTIYYLLGMPINLYNFLRNKEPDFVISTNPVMWFLAKRIFSFLNKDTPVIAWYHYSLAQKPIKKIFLYSADYYLAISSGIKRQLINANIDENKIFTVYNPVVSDYRLIRRPTSAKFVYLGRLELDGQKNLRELIDALKSVNGEWTLNLYGNESNADTLKKYIADSKIEKRIIWHGFEENPWQKIDSATLLLLTSKYEGLPMVLCEAISHGIYCISANTETGPEDIISKENGELYNLGDTEELQELLQSVIDNPQSLPSQKGIITSSKKFSVKNYQIRFNNAIKQIFK